MTNDEALKAWEKFYAEIDKENWLFVGTINPEMVSLAIKALEERPKGEWIDYSNEGYVECPFCQSATTCEDNKDELHYCFNCGAKLN